MLRERVRPTLLGIGVFAASAVLVGAGVAAPASAVTSTATAVARILADTNALRAQHGLAALIENPAIDQVAQNWATQLAQPGQVFDHNPNFAAQLPAGWGSAAENIAGGLSYDTVVNVGWANSSGHLSNMLGNFTDIGIGYYESPDGSHTYFVQNFGYYAAHVGQSASGSGSGSSGPTSSPSPSATPTSAPSATPTPTPSPTQSAGGSTSAPTGSGSVPPQGGTPPPAAPKLPDGVLVKTASNGSVYYADQGTLFPLTSFDVAAQLGVTGYTVVSDATLATGTVASAPLSTFITCSTGTFMATGGVLRAVDTSAMPSASSHLSAAACARIPRGTPLHGRLYLLADGTIWAIENNVRRAATSFTALAVDNGGVVPAYIAVPGAALGPIPVGPLLLTPNQLIKGVTGGTIYFLDGSDRRIPLTSFDVAAQFGSYGYSVVSDQDIEVLAPESGVLSAFVTCGSASYVASAGRLLPVDASAIAGLPTTALSDASCALLPKAPPYAGRLYLLADGTIWAIENGSRRAVTSFAALAAYNGGSIPDYIPVTGASLANIPVGRLILGTNQLVKSPSDATVYFLDGDTAKIPLTNFAIATQFGSNGYATIADADLAAFPTSSSVLSVFVKCGTQNYVMSGGTRIAVTAEQVSGLPITPLSATACAAIPLSTRVVGAHFFVLTPEGTIWSLEGGKRRPISSMAALAAHNGPGAPFYIALPAVAIASLPVGDLI